LQFKYKAVGDNGQVIEGLFDASSKQEVIGMLRNNNRMPISIEETRDSGASQVISFGKVKKKDLAIFCRQFYTMLYAGVSIVKALDILEKQIENKVMKKAVADIHDSVQKGVALSESMKSNANVFPPILINMVEAGEESGNLDTIMDRMAVHYEKEYKIENKIKGAMIYPTVLAVAAIGVVVFMMVAVMPTFIDMFESSGVELPGLTKALLAVSHSLKEQWYFFLMGLAILVFGTGFFLKSELGSIFFDTVKLKIPIVKNTNIKVATSRFTRTLSTLLSSGIPLLQGIDIVSRVINNKNIAKRLDYVKEEVRKGVPLSKAIKDIDLFPPMLDSMINIGEESGALDDILNKTADFYDEEVEVALQTMTEMMQPIMIIVMASIVGFIVLAIALPMFDMVNAI